VGNLPLCFACLDGGEDPAPQRRRRSRSLRLRVGLPVGIVAGGYSDVAHGCLLHMAGFWVPGSIVRRGRVILCKPIAAGGVVPRPQMREMGTSRAKGMAQIASQTGLSREQLYRTFSEKGNPTLKTTLAVMKALGVQLTTKTPAAA